MIDKSIMSAGKSNGQLIESLISEKNLPSDPFSIFILAIRSPVTREKYLQRIGYFFDFLGILKTNDPRSIISVEKRFNTFSVKAREDNNWLTKYRKIPTISQAESRAERDNRFNPTKLHQAHQVILRTNGY
jgi:hypothetical protein